jgi:hypothetical protein
MSIAPEKDASKWASRIVASTCQSKSWEAVLSRINDRVSKRLEGLGDRRFAQLNEAEQIALVSAEFHEVSSSRCCALTIALVSTVLY